MCAFEVCWSGGRLRRHMSVEFKLVGEGLVLFRLWFVACFLALFVFVMFWCLWLCVSVGLFFMRRLLFRPDLWVLGNECVVA